MKLEQDKYQIKGSIIFLERIYPINKDSDTWNLIDNGICGNNLHYIFLQSVTTKYIKFAYYLGCNRQILCFRTEDIIPVIDKK